jgi:alanine racemase
LTDPMSHLDMLRVGAGLVGIDPTGTTVLKPAMTLEAPLVQIREVRAGTGVGYGHAWHAPSTTRLGLVPLGYADGIPRHATNQAEVLISGVRCRVVGRVSMDQTVIDLGQVSAAPGDRVTIFGPGDRGEPTVKEWASWCGTIEHEIVTGIGPRVRRTVIPNSPRLVR